MYVLKIQILNIHIIWDLGLKELKKSISFFFLSYFDGWAYEIILSHTWKQTIKLQIYKVVFVSIHGPIPPLDHSSKLTLDSKFH